MLFGGFATCIPCCKKASKPPVGSKTASPWHPGKPERRAAPKCVCVCMCSITQRLPYHANRSCGQNRKLFSLSDPHGKSRFSTTRPSKGPNPGSTNFAHGTKLSSGLLGPLFTSIVIQAMGLSSPIHIAVNMIGRHVRWNSSEILAQMDWK